MPPFVSLISGLQAKLTKAARVGVVVPGGASLPPRSDTNERDSKATYGVATISGPTQFEDAFGQTYDLGGRTREQYYRDCDTIARNLPEADRALEIISSNVTSGEHGSERALSVEFNGLTAQDEAICHDFMARTQMEQRQKRICRDGLKKGDTYRFNILDKDGFVLGTQRLAPELTTILTDGRGQIAGYRYKGFNAGQQILAPFEVAHYARAVDDDSEPYGRSLFWSGLTVAQSNLGIRDALLYETMVHSGARNVWFMPRLLGMAPDKQRQWKDEMKDAFRRDRFIGNDGTMVRRPNALLNQQDICVDYAVDPEGRDLGKPTVQALNNAPLTQSVEVSRHFQHLLCILFGIPPEILGLESSGKDGLGGTKTRESALQFAAMLNGEQRGLAHYNMRQIEMQFALIGRPLKPGSIILHMPDLRSIDRKVRAEIMWLRAQSFAKLKEAGLSFRALWIEVLFDGDTQEAEQAAERYKVNLDDEPSSTATTSPGVQAKAIESLMHSIGWLKEAMKVSNGASVANSGARQ